MYDVINKYGLAVIGTRHPRPMVRGMAERLACDLAAHGLTIVSGMARGIDSAPTEARSTPMASPWRLGHRCGCHIPQGEPEACRPDSGHWRCHHKRVSREPFRPRGSACIPTPEAASLFTSQRIAPGREKDFCNPTCRRADAHRRNVERLVSHLSSFQIFAALFELELGGRVRVLPGKYYVRVI